MLQKRLIFFIYIPLFFLTGYWNDQVEGTILNLPQSSRYDFPDNLKGLTLVEFYSPNCHHCRTYAKTIRRLSRCLSRRKDPPVRLEQFSCKGGRWCRRLRLQVLPSLRLYRNDQMVAELKGKRSFKAVQKWLSRTFAEVTLQQDVEDDDEDIENDLDDDNGDVDDADDADDDDRSVTPVSLFTPGSSGIYATPTYIQSSNSGLFTPNNSPWINPSDSCTPIHLPRLLGSP